MSGFDPSFVLPHDPVLRPSEFRLLQFKTYTSQRGADLDCSRARIEAALGKDAAAAGEGRSPRYLFGTFAQLRGNGRLVDGDSPHMACARVECRDDGLWAVDATFHGEDHMSFASVGPLAFVNASTGAIEIAGFIFTNSRHARATGLERTPWSLTPYGQCAADFTAAYLQMLADLEGFPNTADRPLTLDQVRMLEERVRTHFTTLKINAECCDGLRASGGKW